jgi:hypothetical protein
MSVTKYDETLRLLNEEIEVKYYLNNDKGSTRKRKLKIYT